MRMYTDPRGEAYEQVIDIAIANSEYFVLGEKLPADMQRSLYASALEALSPYLVKTIVIQGDDIKEVEQIREIYQSHAFYTFGTYYFYTCCEESGNVLKQLANRLSDWIYPRLPEDLCFLKTGGGDYLYSVVHENIYGMEITEEEAVELMERVTGLFMQLKAHSSFDRLLDDAIKHQSDKLYISRHKLTELPDRIQGLTELRDLTIFEQDLDRLPEALFDLTKLEHLHLMTADLESIPPSIAKLKNLRVLIIQCGSSDRPIPGYRVKPKEEISLNRIPPEIGELERLEQLTIHHSSIHELPIELKKLKQLRTLDIQNSMIEHQPAFLHEMNQLKQVHVLKNWMWELYQPE